MCGIVGAVAERNVVPILMEGLRRLEYRGYDSAGIAILEDGGVTRTRRVGKVQELQKALDDNPVHGVMGISHTRWATHGVPNESNAHPQATDKVAVVHNGIIENFRELREKLIAAGHKFASETDTEVVAHLVTDYMQKGKSPVDAVAATLKQLRGTGRS